MKKLGIALILATGLLVSGCSVTTPVAPTPTETQAESQITSISADSTVDEIVQYAEGLTASTPDVAAKIRDICKLLPAALGDSLPWDVHNKVNQDLIALNAATFENNDPATLVADLGAILGEIKSAQ